MSIQMRILAYGKGSVLVDDVKEAAQKAGITVVVEESEHFAAGLYCRGNFTPAAAQVRSIASD
eukprot:scaffold124117_cov60-Phaeocystis_antarctica.AAC.1